mmetsp:Transcript_53629/g.117230  ORF Transcript_53629/g.117230 Transcript_53629/m.117230 type:complete len:109 (+) Transcript_53629:282-608(+)
MVGRVLQLARPACEIDHAVGISRWRSGATTAGPKSVAAGRAVELASLVLKPAQSHTASAGTRTATDPHGPVATLVQLPVYIVFTMITVVTTKPSPPGVPVHGQLNTAS